MSFFVLKPFSLVVLCPTVEIKQYLVLKTLFRVTAFNIGHSSHREDWQVAKDRGTY